MLLPESISTLEVSKRFPKISVLPCAAGIAANHAPLFGEEKSHARRPEGRRTGCAPFSDRAMDGESENPDDNEAALIASSGKALSLVTFFAPAKKVTRRKAKAFQHLMEAAAAKSSRLLQGGK